MATTTINASKQTYARSGTQSTWSAARDATSSLTHTNYTTTQVNNASAIREYYDSGRKGDAYIVRRSFFFFDTSTIDGTITAISLKIQGVTNGGNNVRVAKSTAYGGGGGSAYANSDFDGWTTTNGLIPTPYNASSYSWTTSTNTITLNATAISNANSDDYLNLVVVGGNYDYPDQEMLLPQDLNSGIQFASSTTFPQLFITYTPTPTGYQNYPLGIADDEFQEVNGVDKGDIEEIIGV